MRHCRFEKRASISVLKVYKIRMNIYFSANPVSEPHKTILPLHRDTARPSLWGILTARGHVFEKTWCILTARQRTLAPCRRATRRDFFLHDFTQLALHFEMLGAHFRDPNLQVQFRLLTFFELGRQPDYGAAGRLVARGFLHWPGPPLLALCGRGGRETFVLPVLTGREGTAGREGEGIYCIYRRLDEPRVQSELLTRYRTSTSLQCLRKPDIHRAHS